MKKNYGTKFCYFVLAFFTMANMGAQQTYTFTNCGATGSVGPTQAQVNVGYTLTNLSGQVGTLPSGIQTWTVPYTGNFRIEARGAQGGISASVPGGMGATMAGDFSLIGGEVIQILVGQVGDNGGTGPGGGSGGSFVVRTPYTTTASILVIAGGGSGAGTYSFTPGVNTTAGVAGGVAGGTNGSGGLGGIRGAGGGGFLTDGAPCSASTLYASPGQAFVNGGRGGPVTNNITCNFTANGGFGGGSSHGGYCINNGGAGGGFSGGGGSSNTTSGGGGSLNQGTNQTNVTGNNTGNGKVIITELCSVKLYASGSNSVNPSLCSGNSLTLTTDAVSNYSWSTGNTTSSVIVVNPTTTTVYSVQGTSSLSCVSVGFITVTVNSAVPSLTVINTATASSGICPGNTVAISASGATTYSFTGGISNGMTFTPSAAAVYTITGYNACGSSTAATSVSVHTVPSITASISQPTICSGNTLTTLASGAVSYTWSHGAPNGQALYPFATTMYTVVGTSVLNCTAQAMIGVTVETTPILAPIATPTVICMGGSGTVAVSGASNYTWLPVPANNFAGSNNGTITITPTVTATYTVVKANSNCNDTKMITVYVNALPNVFAITSHTVVCAGSSATLSGGGASSYTWTPSSFNLVGNNVVVSPIAATIYTCTGNDGTCTAVYTVAVGTNPVPIIQATASTPSLCVGGSVTLNATGALTYTWNPGGQGAQITDTPLIPTNYIVSGTNIYTCTSQAQVPVIVYPNPTVNAVPNKTLVCLNGPSTITASGANSYVWTTGSLTHTTLVFPPATTVYTVTGTYSNSGCSSSKTVMVQAYTPVTGINGPTAVCIGSGITISSAPANSYTWTVGGNFLSNQASVLISPTVNTTYMLGTTSTSNQVSCVGGNSVNIQVNALPVITASAVGNRTLICKGESVDLFASGGLTYVWTFQGNTSLITVTPQAQTTYTVEGTDINGCKNTATITIKLSGCPGFAELSNNATNITVYPNPSSGEFKISAEQNMRLVLINELGQVIREVELNAQNAYSVDIKGLSKGVYFINSKNTEHQFNKKIVVQ